MKTLMDLQKINVMFRKNRQTIGIADRVIHVLKDIDLSIQEGEILAVVGESGCGKTTLGKIITGLIRPNSGEILFQGERLTRLFAKNIHSYQAVQFIQQDSYAALNPVRTIGQNLEAPLRTKHPSWSKEDVKKRIFELMKLINLEPAEQFLTKYPHQLSGGQRQRILMARALSLDPKMIVADEPVSMIDVSLRLSLLNLMANLNEQFGVTFVYITHDLSTARYIAKNGRLCVMYLGEIVEMGSVDRVLSNPRHPYTKALLQAVPTLEIGIERMEALPLKSMELASLETRTVGCSFAPRCLYATKRCTEPVPHVIADEVLIKCCNLKEGPLAKRNG